MEGPVFCSSSKRASRLVKYILFLSAGYGFSLPAAIVETIGRAPEDSRAYKEQALSDALREAVRVGAGINLASQSKSENYTLDFDRIFTASFGYVRSYRVIQTGMQHGVYSVKIQADVSQGDVNTNDELALRQLISLKKSPKIAIDIAQDVTFVTKGNNYAADWFLDKAKSLHLHVIEIGEGPTKSDSRPIIESSKTVSSEQQVYDYDFLVKGNLEGRYEILNSDSGSPYSLGASFEVVSPETGEIIASLVLPPSSNMKSSIQSPKIAAREVIFKYLDGEKGSGNEGAAMLFRRIFSRWSADLDLGRNVQVEIEGIEPERYQNLIQELNNQERVGFVDSKIIDPKGVSKFVVETRYVQPELLDIIQKNLRRSHSLKFSSQSMARFEPKDLSLFEKIADLFVGWN